MKTYLVNNRLVKEGDLKVGAMAMSDSDLNEISKPVEKHIETEVINDSDLDELTVKELKAKAKELELELPKNIKKGELIDLIESALDDSEE